MSLINDALKKAQRERTEEPADPTAPTPSGNARIAKRGKPHRATTMVLVGSGALVLVVLSVVITVVLLNRSSPPAPRVAETSAPAAVPTATPPVAPSSDVPTTPIVVPPIATLPVPPPADTTPSPSTSPAVAVTDPQSTEPAKAEPPSAAAASVESTPTPASPGTPDERVAAFVEAIRVTGIRSSGAESRVLMNERVYRVNDIVERTLNVRLTAVGTDSLTFTDANGVTYVKYF